MRTNNWRNPSATLLRRDAYLVAKLLLFLVKTFISVLFVDDKKWVYAVKYLIFSDLNLWKSLKISNLKERFTDFSQWLNQKVHDIRPLNKNSLQVDNLQGALESLAERTTGRDWQHTTLSEYTRRIIRKLQPRKGSIIAFKYYLMSAKGVPIAFKRGIF